MRRKRFGRYEAALEGTLDDLDVIIDLRENAPVPRLLVGERWSEPGHVLNRSWPLGIDPATDPEKVPEVHRPSLRELQALTEAHEAAEAAREAAERQRAREAAQGFRRAPGRTPPLEPEPIAPPVDSRAWAGLATFLAAPEPLLLEADRDVALARAEAAEAEVERLRREVERLREVTRRAEARARAATDAMRAARENVRIRNDQRLDAMSLLTGEALEEYFRRQDARREQAPLGELA